MRCGRRSASIPTVHFKRQSSSLSSLSQTANSLPPPSIDSDNPFPAVSFCSSLLKLSARVGHACDVDQVHGYAIKLGLCSSLSLRRVLSSMVGLDYISFIGLMRLCTECSDVGDGSQIHCLIVKQGHGWNCCLSTSLVDFYGKCGFVAEARRVFSEVPGRDLVLWNTLISSYVLNGMPDEAIGILKLMRWRTVFRGDGYTFSSILSACGSVQGMQLHGSVLKLSLESDIPVATSLINMYAKSSRMRDARKCFDSTVARNVVTWNSMIVGYGKIGDGREAMRVLVKMLRENVHPDEYTFASILSSFLEVMSACSHGGLVREGLQYFEQMMSDLYKIEPDSEHYTCLIDLLSRAGFIDDAYKVLMAMPVEPSSHALAAFSGACKVHGNRESMKWAAKKVLELEPSNPANYSMLSNIYMSEGHWMKSEHLRKTVKKVSNSKIPGCSWVGE